MGRSPLGVAMGVSGEAQTQRRQPLGQVPSAVGGVQAGNSTAMGPGTMQQSSPVLQQLSPQQRAPAPQAWPGAQGGFPQRPWSQ